MTLYLLGIQQPDGPAPANIDEIMRDVTAVDTAMRDAGVWVFGGGLTPASDAAVVRGTLIVDGPYVEAKEHLGGLTVISVPDRDTALHWATRLAGATGLPIEVRAFQG